MFQNGNLKWWQLLLHNGVICLKIIGQLYPVITGFFFSFCHAQPWYCIQNTFEIFNIATDPVHTCIANLGKNASWFECRSRPRATRPHYFFLFPIPYTELNYSNSLTDFSYRLTWMAIYKIIKGECLERIVLFGDVERTERLALFLFLFSLFFFFLTILYLTNR